MATLYGAKYYTVNASKGDGIEVMFLEIFKSMRSLTKKKEF